MKYYFVDTVHKPDPDLDSKSSNKTNSKQSKITGKTRNTNKGIEQKDRIPILKLRTIRAGPLRKGKAPPREPQLPTRRNRRTKNAPVAVMPQRLNPRAAAPPTPRIRQARALKVANVERNIAKPRRQTAQKVIPEPATPPRRSPRLRQVANTEMDDNSEDDSEATIDSPVSEPRTTPQSGGRASSSRGQTSRESTVNQNVSIAEEPKDDDDDDDGFLCPWEKIRHTCWHYPFMLVLDQICEAPTDFQEIYNQYLPAPENMRAFNSRSGPYGAIELGVGLIAYELNDQLGLDIPASQRAIPTHNELKEARRKFERKYLDSLALLKNVRRMIGQLPSIFWYYPTETMFRIFSLWGAGLGGGTQATADRQYEQTIGRYVQGNRFRDTLPRALRFVRRDRVQESTRVQQTVIEHACRVFQDGQYEPGVKNTLPNHPWPDANETPKSFWLRYATRQNAEQYHQQMAEIQGFRFSDADDAPEHSTVRDHGLADLAANCIGMFGYSIKNEYIDAPIQVVSALATELDASMSIANATQAPETDEARRRDIYGHHDGAVYQAKPYNLLQQYSTFFLQCFSLAHVISGGPNQQINDEDFVELFDCLRFQVLVQDFQELNRHVTPKSYSILDTRLRNSQFIVRPQEERSGRGGTNNGRN